MNQLENLKRNILNHQMYYLELYKVSPDFMELIKKICYKYYNENNIEQLKILVENLEGINWYFKLTK